MSKKILNLNYFVAKKDLQRLEASGLKDLYKLITYLPFDLKKIQVLNFSQLNQLDWFLAEVELLNFEHKQGKSPFFTLFFKTSNNQNLKVYWFVRGKWAFDFLKTNELYQILLAYKQPFYNLVKIAPKKAEINHKYFEIGKANLQTYFVPKYTKIGNLTSIDLLRIHQKIPDYAYLLDLQGLIPKNEIIPPLLNLAKVHKPNNLNDFHQGLNSWVAFQAFLKMILIKSIDLEKKQEFAFKSKTDRKFLQELSLSLNFNLSNSQKLAVWEILKNL